ncbi:MAG TPA: sigma-70 family RNA polymerase sigma factor [Phycisphaerales bacterium]
MDPAASLNASPEATVAPRSQSQAFGDFYREHYQAIAGLVYRRTGDTHVTEDLTADVFLSAYKSMDEYRGQVPPIVWLRRIANNRVNRWVRREIGLRGILRRLPLFSVLVAPETNTSEPRSAALTALLRLPVDQQEVLSAHYLEGLSLEEVALMLSISPAAAKSRLARARDALRRELAHQAKESHP